MISKLLKYIKKRFNTIYKGNRWFFALTIISSFVFLLWFFAFYPGVMSVDSLSQWEQAMTGKYNNWHPFVSTLYIQTFQLFSNSPALISLFQLFLTSLLFSYIFQYFIKQGIPKIIIFVCFGLFVSSIPIGVYNITIWKDVPFSLFIVALSFFIIMKRGESGLNKKGMAVYLFLSMGCIFFRHNGILFLFVIPLVSFILWGRSAIKSVVLIFVFFGIINYIVPSWLGVVAKPTNFDKWYVVHSTIGLYKFLPWTNITQDSKTYIEKLMSTDELTAQYSPVCADYIAYDPDLNGEVLQDVNFWNTIESDFYKHNLPLNLNYVVAEKTNLFISTSMGMRLIFINNIEKNELGLESQPISDSLNSFFNSVLFKTLSSPLLRGIVWNSLIPILLISFVFIDSVYKRKKGGYVLALMTIPQVVGITIFSTCADWRYLYFCYLAGFIAIPMYFVKPDKLRKT